MLKAETSERQNDYILRGIISILSVCKNFVFINVRTKQKVKVQRLEANATITQP